MNRLRYVRHPPRALLPMYRPRLPTQDPAKDSEEEDLEDNNEDAEWATSSDHDERPECDDTLKGSSASRSGSSGSGGRSSSRASIGSAGGERCGTSDSHGGGGKGRDKKGRSSPKRRMSMSMLLPEGPVRRHRYQPPPTVHTYLNKMNSEVRSHISCTETCALLCVWPMNDSYRTIQ